MRRPGSERAAQRDPAVVRAARLCHGELSEAAAAGVGSSGEGRDEAAGSMDDGGGVAIPKRDSGSIDGPCEPAVDGFAFGRRA